VVGVDGGATKTDAVVMTAGGSVVGSGRAGCSNWESVGLAAAVDAIALAVDDALREAGRTRRDVEASVFALAGVDWPGDQVHLADALNFLGLGGERFITNDAFAALRRHLRTGRVCLVGGHGAVAAGRNEAGQTAHDGRGLRQLGGAGDIIERALWACARMRGVGPDTALASSFCAALGVPDLDSLFEGIKRHGLAVGAELAPLVLDAAARGDAVARLLLEEQGRSLADEVLGVARRLGMLDTPFELVIAGSVHLAGSPSLDSAFATRVGELAPRARIIPLRERPVVGAARLALEQIGVA
jgi:N-acetylglucosamine kinase-like BadF-type ATPase